MHRLIGLILGIVLVAGLTSTTSWAQLPDGTKSDLGPGVPSGFRVRPGYRVTVAFPKDKFPGRAEARFMQFSSDGKTLYVSARHEGEIYALTDPDKDGVYQKLTKFVKNMRSVQGMDFHDGWLYFQVPSEGSIYRAKDTKGDGVADQIENILPKGTLPKPGNHPYNALLVTDKEIYVSASDPQNFTEAIDSPSKKIYVCDPDGKNLRVFCSGVRNTEKLRFRPGTTEIWGFDHGSDNVGKNFGEETARVQPITDLNPPEELNHYVQDGFYGHPYISGTGMPRPEFVGRSEFNLVELASKTIPPELNIHAHWAVNGWTFITSDYWGADRKGDIFFASHGSWNSVKPVGAVVQRVMFDQVTGHPCGQMTIVDCGGDNIPKKARLARPVDVTEAPDGTLLFSSDEPSGVIYRISKSTGTN